MKTIFTKRPSAGTSTPGTGTFRMGAGALATALGACALLVAPPALAHERYPDRGNSVAIAVGAGILGLAVGAALADRDDRYYYDRSRYSARRYVVLRDRPGYYYYYEGRPNRYYRDRYYDRYYAPYYRKHHRDWRRGPDGYRRDHRPAYRHDGPRYERHDDRRHDNRRHDRGHDRGHDRHHDRGGERGWNRGPR